MLKNYVFHYLIMPQALEDSEVLGDFDFSDEKGRMGIARVIAKKLPATVHIFRADGKYRATCSNSPAEIPQNSRLAVTRSFIRKDLEAALYASALTLTNKRAKKIIWQKETKEYRVYYIHD